MENSENKIDEFIEENDSIEEVNDDNNLIEDSTG